MSAAARFKQSDVTRAFKAARGAGFSRVRVRIDVDGSLVVDADDAAEPLAPVRQNPLDRILRRAQ